MKTFVLLFLISFSSFFIIMGISNLFIAFLMWLNRPQSQFKKIIKQASQIANDMGAWELALSLKKDAKWHSYAKQVLYRASQHKIGPEVCGQMMFKGAMQVWTRDNIDFPWEVS